MDERTIDREPEVLNHEELLARCMGNLEFAARLLEKFQASFGGDLETLEESVDARDAEQTRCIAHRLKGASANISAPRLCRCATEIEQLSRESRLDEIPPRLESLRDEWSRFVDAASSRDVGAQ